MDNLNISRNCCDPFGNHKKKITKHLRVVTRDIIDRYPQFNLTTNHKVCGGCRMKLTKDPSPVSEFCEKDPSPVSELSEHMISLSESESTDRELEIQYERSKINESLSNLNETPIKSKLSITPKYAKKKYKKVETVIKRKLELCTGQSISSGNESDETAQGEILEQLKEKFKEVQSRSQKITILTLLPKSWSSKKIVDEFKCTNYMARQAMNLVKEHGIFSSPNPKLGKQLHKEIAAKIIDFYRSSDISREMPGMKDYISVKRNDGSRERKQKFLILCNLKEAYQKFKENHPSIKIGFSKFAELRPKECVLAGDSGTHCVCVCAKHQNVKLMFAAIEKVFKHDINYFSSTCDNFPDTNYISNYRHCLSLLHCNPPQEKCFFGKCDNCPKKEALTDLLTRVFERKGIDEVQFRQWVSTDRSSLEARTLSADEFIQIFHEKLQALLTHDFIAKIQAQHQREKKETLSEGEFLVVGDFAENYSFIIQDAVQSFHWNNCQATLHPFVIYYRKDNQIMHKSFVAISDCNKHDAVAVHLFQTHLINFLKSSHQVSKVFYFSDGCAAQYKNCKNFINLCYHKQDFQVDAEWHFFATSHGKGPCDGIGGTVKRLAAKTSIQRTGGTTPILDPRALYDFAVSALPTISFTFTTSEEHEAHRVMLEKRFKNARTIPGTQKIHCIQPVSKEQLEVRSYSSSTVSRLEDLTTFQKNKIPLSSMKGFCLAAYDDHWYLACILEVKPDCNEINLSFLHPPGPASSFVYPTTPDELIIDISDVLLLVSPNTMTGRTYTLKQSEMNKANSMFQKK